MSRLDVASLHKGDVIETTRTHHVTYVSGDYVETEDVQDGRRFGFAQRDVDESTLKLQMVKRAVRKPKVGDVINGAELKATRWKHGTVIQSGADASYVYMLHRDGKWHCAQFEGGNPFCSFGDREKLGLLHVA